TSFMPKVISESLPKDRFLVVVTASQYFNTFDTVYIDTNMDGQIKDEVPLMKYSRQNQVVSIKGKNNKVFNMVVSEINNDKKYVKFGFDANGHGTEVAGIVAANGQIEGVAPGAQILPIKVLNNLGLAYLDRLENAILLAAEMGANIAVMSMGQYQITPDELKKMSNLANRMWNSYGMLLCIAVGNNGPGLGTVADTAAIRNVISVGAYAVPEMWRNDYGWEIEKPTLWYFSSSGPGVDGIAAPVVVAPGSVMSTFPMWGNSMYRLDEGTSMAAPHVAGAAALLSDVVTHKMYISDSMIVAQGLVAGAIPLEGYEAVEQGFGAVNLVRAWQEIQRVKDQYANFKVNQYSPDFGYGNGYYSKEIAPASLTVKIFNNSNENRYLAVGGLSSWIKPQQFSLQVPQQGERTITVKYEELTEPGLYSDFLVADDYDTPGWDVAVLQTVVVPYNLEELPNHLLEKKDKLGAGEFKRYFINVPEGTDKLDISLEVGNRGRARMHIISPLGYQDVSQYAGAGEINTSPNVSTTYANPAPGTWEIVVYSSATLSNYDLRESQYTLKASIGEVIKDAPKAPDKRYLVTAYPPRELIEGEKNEVVLHFWNVNTKTPAEGVVTINGRLYEINQGLVRVEVIPDGDELNFKIAW
ncbi:MAG: S8 family serine peptidase, partial [Syntrophomonadaceae bacterium]|nr:S8 family serine peptidase [Syntrophomonadaceae bacterium]